MTVVTDDGIDRSKIQKFTDYLQKKNLEDRTSNDRSVLLLHLEHPKRKTDYLKKHPYPQNFLTTSVNTDLIHLSVIVQKQFNLPQ